MKCAALFCYEGDKIKESSAAMWASHGKPALVGSQKEHSGCFPAPTWYRVGLKHPKISGALAGAPVEGVGSVR